MTASKPKRAGSPRKDANAVRPVVEQWLATLELGPLDAVRAQLALTLATEIDTADAPAYAKARLTTELRSVLAEITKATLGGNGKRDVKQLLAEVM